MPSSLSHTLSLSLSRSLSLSLSISFSLCVPVWLFGCVCVCVCVCHRFVKLCKDVGFIGAGNHLTTTDADLVFQKTKRSGNYGKRICYEDFRMVAIPEMARRMKCQ